MVLNCKQTVGALYMMMYVIVGAAKHLLDFGN